MRVSDVRVNFGGGFMYVFEGHNGGNRWRTVTAGTVRHPGGNPGFGEHKLALFKHKGTAMSPAGVEPIDAGASVLEWALDGCTITVLPDLATGVVAPLDEQAQIPANPNGWDDAEWENWKWVIDPKQFHESFGHAVKKVLKQFASCVLFSGGSIVPRPGFSRVRLTAGGYTPEQPVSNVTTWRPSAGVDVLAVHVAGTKNGTIRFTPDNDGFLSLTFLHIEPYPDPLAVLKDFAMLYELVDVPIADRITAMKSLGFDFRCPGKDCVTGRFYPEA